MAMSDVNISDTEKEEVINHFAATLIMRAKDLRAARMRKSSALSQLKDAESDIERHVRALSELAYYYPSYMSLAGDMKVVIDVWKKSIFRSSTQISSRPEDLSICDPVRNQRKKSYYNGWETEFLSESPIEQTATAVTDLLYKDIASLRGVLCRLRSFLRVHFAHQCECDMCKLDSGPRARLESAIRDVDQILEATDE